MMNFISNSFKTVFFWVTFNTFFITINTIATNYFGYRFLPMKNIKDIVISLILISAYILCLVVLFYLGKKILKTTGNLALDFVSIFPWQILILIALYLAHQSEHTFVFALTWTLQMFQPLFGRVANIPSNRLISSFTVGIILSCIPYLFMYLGLLVKTLKEKSNKSKGLQE